MLTLQLVLSFIFIGFVFLFAPYLPNQTTESVLALKVYSLALIPLAFFTVVTSVLRGAQKMTSTREISSRHSSKPPRSSSLSNARQVF